MNYKVCQKGEPMKKYITAILLTYILILTGCTTHVPNGSDSADNQKKNKTVLTMGIMYDDGLLQSILDVYNADSDTYYVELQSYEAYENPCQQFLLDVASGKAPDIIEVGMDFPASVLLEKNMLLELDPYLEKDPDIKKTDLVDNVVEAMETDGSLYYLCDGVGLSTLLAKTADVGTMTGWNEEEFLTFLATKPEDQMLFQLNSKPEILGKLLDNNLAQYVDWTTGTCQFDSEQFKNLLLTAGRGKDTIIEDVPFPKLLQDGEILFNELGNSGMMDTISACDIFNEPVTAIGYPCKNREGSYFRLNHSFGICSQTKNPDGAWDFLRTFVSKEHQSKALVEQGAYYIPTRKDVFDRMISDHQITEAYEDENGYTIEPFSDSYSYGDYTITYGPLTDEQVQTFLDIFNRTHKLDGSDTAISNIIIEETEAYYKGEKDANETAKIIQNRVTTYVNESR